MQIEQIYTGCLAQGAYYIQSNGEAAIIDPLREIQPYLDRLEKDGVELKYIFETHFHADFVSGHVTLSERTGAPIVYGPTAKTQFEVITADDGQEFKLGELTFVVLHTPGHTLESSSFLLKDKDGQNHAIFSGDTLFLGDVGRPDLAQKQGSITVEDLAGMLFDSLRNKIMPLEDEVIVYPAHGAGSACGKNMMKETVDTLGNQRKVNYALREDMTKEEFIKEVTDGLLPPPVYFAKNAALNKAGYDSIDKVLKHGAHPLKPVEFLAMAEEHEPLILDVRSKEEFAKSHIPGSVFIGLDGSFAPWAGSLIPDIKQEILLVTPSGKAVEVITRLARVGYDNTIGYLEGTLEDWTNAGYEIDTIDSIPADEFAEQLSSDLGRQILDVRKPTEFLSQRVDDSSNFPLDYINNNMNKVDRSGKYFLYCRSGYRSMVAASILKSRGYHNVIDIEGGFAEILENDSIGKTEYVCPTTMSQETIDKAVAEVI
jgi:glyoxylase-like metal-dependent hydrolase (beta-lactamase superfamily II)/rhodanese-related sulfurtransferase